MWETEDDEAWWPDEGVEVPGWEPPKPAKGPQTAGLKRKPQSDSPKQPPPKRTALEEGATGVRKASTPSWAASGSSWSEGAWWPPRASVGHQDKADIAQWVECSRIGKVVPGTPIVPCKTPFEGSLADRAYEAGLIKDEDWFDKDSLVQLCKAQGTPLGLVVDLVNTEKYYAGFSEAVDGIEYRKVRIVGRSVPERELLEEVFDSIDSFVARRPGEYVAVHCTHGINRTGFLVAAYLMTRAQVPTCRKAVARFEGARGIKMDKLYLLEALMDLEEGRY